MLQCPDVNTNTEGRVGEQLTDGVGSWQECSDLCQNRNDCKFWTWHHGNAGYYAYKCVTMKNAGNKTGDPNCVSGERTCKGNKFVSIIVKSSSFLFSSVMDCCMEPAPSNI